MKEQEMYPHPMMWPMMRGYGHDESKPEVEISLSIGEAIRTGTVGTWHVRRELNLYAVTHGLAQDQTAALADALGREGASQTLERALRWYALSLPAANAAHAIAKGMQNILQPDTLLLAYAESKEHHARYAAQAPATKKPRRKR